MDLARHRLQMADPVVGVQGPEMIGRLPAEFDGLEIYICGGELQSHVCLIERSIVKGIKWPKRAGEVGK